MDESWTGEKARVVYGGKRQMRSDVSLAREAFRAGGCHGLTEVFQIKSQIILKTFH